MSSLYLTTWGFTTSESRSSHKSHTFCKSFKFIISDGNHSYTADAKSDFYIELGNNGYEKIEETELEQRLANKTGRGTIIHLLKNGNTPTDKNGYVLGI